MSEWRQELLGRLASLNLRPEREADIVEELSQHLDDRVRDLRTGGMTEDAARHAALADLDEPGEMSRRLRDALGQQPRRLPEPSSARTRFANIRFGMKLLRSARELPAAVLALAIGVGLTATAYSLIHAVLLTPLPYREPERLVTVADDAAFAPSTLNELHLRTLRSTATPFSALATFTTATGVVGAASPLRGVPVTGALVSGNIFDLLGVAAATGRTLTATDDISVEARPIVISERLVQAGAASSQLDQTLRIDGTSFRVVGIMPATFWFPDRDTDYWAPLVITPAMRGATSPKMFAFATIARLAGTVEVASAGERANAQLQLRTGDTGVVVRPYSASLTSSARSPLLALQTSAGLLLLLTGLNAGWLFAARGRRLRHVYATMQALGATTRGVVTASLVSALAVAAAAAPAAVLLAWLLLRHVLAPDPGVFSKTAEPAITWQVVAVALVTTLFTSVAAWLPGAVAMLRRRHVLATQMAVHSVTWKLERAAMAVQVALVFGIATQAVMVSSTLRAVGRVNVGVSRTDFVVIRATSRGGATEPRVQLARYQTLIRGLHEQGVRVAIASTFPLTGESTGITFGARVNRAIQRGITRIRVVTPDYFPITGMTATTGRVLTDDDAGGRLALVNDVLAGPRPAQALGTGIGFDSPWTIVGVVPTVRQFDFYEVGTPEAYVLYDDALTVFSTAAVSDWLNRTFLLADTAAGIGPVVGKVRAAMASAMPDMDLGTPSNMHDLINARLGVSRLVSTASNTLALVALFLAASGLYGMVSQHLAGRRREIGIRMAIGATTRRIAAEAVRPLAVTLSAGLTAGVVLGMLGTSTISSVILPPRGFGYPPLTAVATIVTAVLVMMFVAACYRPMRDITRVNPAHVLRKE